MRPGWRSGAMRIVRSPGVVGGTCVVLVAALLYSRFDLRLWVNRDAFLYLYGGQRVLHGQPPYVSEMDPKGPVSSLLVAGGVEVAKLFGRDDILVVRVEFIALAILGVLGVFLLVRALFDSVLAAVFAAVSFTAFRSFAFNAVAGPEGHQPGIVFFIFALWLTVRRRWYLAGIAAALSFLTWQPLFIFPIAVAVCAVAWSPGRRWRALATALAGVATPSLALVIYYSWGGHLRALWDGLVWFPLTGVVRRPMSLVHRLRFFYHDVGHIYGRGAILVWLGLALLLFAAVWTVATARDRREALLHPLVLLMAGTLVVQLGYVAYDYIGYPHSFPMLPYAATGLGWGAARVLAWTASVRWVRPAVAAATVLIALASLIRYSRPDARIANLTAEQAGACALQDALPPGTPLWTIDNPGPLVLLHRRQPDNFPYVGGGLDVWKVAHTPGGFRGWTHEIAASGASVVVLESWLGGQYQPLLRSWLFHHGYRRGHIGEWDVYVNAAARAQMAAHSLKLTQHRQIWPLTTTGGRYTVTHCPARGTGFAPKHSTRLPKGS